MKKIKTLIVGLGNIGMMQDYSSSKKNILTHSSFINSNNKFELVGGVDLKENKLKLFKRKFSKPVFTNFEKAVSYCNPNLIVICVNAEKNLKIIKRLKKFNGIILLEKPLSNEKKISQNLIKIIKKNRLNVFINYFREYFLNIRKELKIFSKSSNKKKCIIHYSSSFYNLVHHLSMALIILKKPISVKVLNKDKKNPDVFIKFSNGELMIISNKYFKYENDKIEFFNTKNSIQINLNPLSLRKYQIKKDEIFKGHFLLSQKPIKKEIFDKNFFSKVYENIYYSYYNKKNFKVSLHKSLTVDILTSKIKEKL